MKLSATAPPNRLGQAASPYLQQHAHNPVDWHEWSPEALELARRTGKPIFLSIGYAACHWCHVMAHESFENPEIAAVLNDHFVNVKVDREERPDLDEIYMQATLVLNNGQGGWPMSVWLTPDLKPFFAGTYFPPNSRWGRPGFKELCQKIGEAWRERRAEIIAQADKLAEVVHDSLRATAGDGAPLPADLVARTAEALARAFDAQSGGLVSGGTNKFPPSMAMDLMLRTAARLPADAAQRQQLSDLAALTLDRMAEGGIYDQLGGGFHRYSTDLEWHVPHFEKMLYDQALVGRIYLDGYQFFGKPLYARIARETFDYVLADLRAPEGGFYSTRDADSEGEEGKYYVWTRGEVLAALGEEDGPLFCCYYDITDLGNWNDAHAPGVPKSIPRVLRSLELVARLHKLDPLEVAQRISRGRLKLLDVRRQRVPPALDDKILCEWNGLLSATLARGGAVLGDRRYVDAARQAVEFVLTHMRRDGRLLRVYRGGRTLPTAFLSDYATMIEALLELYEATFEPRWLDEALALNRTLVRHHWDEQAGGFYFTADDHEPLIARAKDVRDNATPSGNSVQLVNLMRLAVLTGDDALRHLADRQVAAFAGEIRQAPWAAERFLVGIDLAYHPPVEIALVGDPADAETQALLKTIHGQYLPNRVLALRRPDRPESTFGTPLLANKTKLDGRATAYVCRNYVCQRPVATPEELRAVLAGAV